MVYEESFAGGQSGADLQLALENMESVSAEEHRLRAEREVPLTQEGATPSYSQLCELGRAAWSPPLKKMHGDEICTRALCPCSETTPDSHEI